jgi:hypothetical protein
MRSSSTRVFVWCLSVGLMVLMVAVPARAQGTFGVSGGVSSSPKQGFGGAQMEWRALEPHTNLTFRPDVDLGFGGGVTLVTADFLIAYWVQLADHWHAYLAAGPSAVYAHQSNCGTTCQGGNSVDGSFALAVGFQTDSGVFFELKAGGGPSAGMRVAVGFWLKGRK